MRTSRLLREARAPNQFLGLACADPGYPRAALDANDLWIRSIGAQHPVESYRQLACCRYLGHAFRFAMTALLIRPPQTLVATHRALRRFHQQLPQEPVALLADPAQPLPSARAVLARNQPHIAGHLLAPLKPPDIADGHRKRQCRDRPHPKAGSSTTAPFCLSERFLPPPGPVVRSAHPDS